MPQENEIKFIVRWNLALEEELKSGYDWVHIEQAYLNDRARIRKKTWMRGAHEQSYVFTYKQRLANGRNIEIETLISEADYIGLLPFAAERLTKSRVTIYENEVRWDIDFPYWKLGKHFIIAEAEMPEYMDYPERVLAVLRPYIIYAVPRSDRRFTARRLSVETNALSLAIELGLR